MGMFSQLAQGVDWSSIGAMALRIVAVLLCLVVHEVCHGLAAYWLGDPTAKQSHRLSLNPIHHLDPFGLLMMVVVGLAGPSPCGGPRYFRKPKQGIAITALAGPVSNFLLAYVSAILYSGLYAQLVWWGDHGAGLGTGVFRRTDDPEHRPGYFQLDSLPPWTVPRFGHVPVGPAIRSGCVWSGMG
ncbi:MAG: site-2 protease family protein [Evtepia gabavorous]